MKGKDAFFWAGSLIYKLRFPILMLWLFMMLASIPFVPHILEPFKSTGFVDDTSKSVKTDKFLEKKLGYGHNRILISYTSQKLKTTDPIFLRKIKDSLTNLKKYPIAHDIFYPNSYNKQIAKDKHTAYAIVAIKKNTPLTEDELNQFKTLIKRPFNMSVKLGGEPIFIDDIGKQTQKDLYRADIVAAPLSVIIMLLIFGSVVSALIPVFLGGSCALLILISLYCLGHYLTLSIFTLNIALLLGLCLSLDYALFIISRFKDELTQDKPVQEAIATTLNTAGKAVFFSGVAVFISLSVLLFFPINILFSIGVGGLVAVFVAVFLSIIVLPAILSILKTKINLLPVTLFKKKREGHHFWGRLVARVIKRPLIYFFLILSLLLMLGYPILNVKIGMADEHILPKHVDSRQFLDEYRAKFDEKDLTPIVLVVSSNKEKILSNNSLSKLYDFANKLKKNKAIDEVNSIVTTDKKLTKNQYQLLYNAESKPSEIKQLLKNTTREHFTVMYVTSKYPINSDETKALISQLERLKPGKGMSLSVTGVPVNNAQTLETIKKLFPYALVWIIGFTYLVLLILLRSVFLPFKAILMNFISLTASYGVLVYIFQEGHLHEYLHFTPQGLLDISLLIIIFCALFGFSMDYEVFLLTRIKEFYEETKDNNQSIILGIDKSSRIITSAALIVIVLCGSFMVAEVLMVKEFGLGIAVTIFVDAFLVRSILVPSTMALLDKWNWYLPRWLDRIIP